MDDITALEYHIDEDIVMDNFAMEIPYPAIERSDRRKFLKMVIGSVLGSFALIPALPSFLFGMYAPGSRSDHGGTAGRIILAGSPADPHH